MGATVLQLGQWNTVADSFGPASSSPTGAIIDLNDGVNWTLNDTGSGWGEGLDWGEVRPTAYKSSNVRTVGERVTRRVYQQNRQVRVNLFLGQATTYANYMTTLHTLVATLEGISQSQPATLKVQVTGASSPVYLDVVEGHLVTHYKELQLLQLLDDGVLVEFEARPFFRGPRQTLQNLVMNPGFEAPFGGGVATTPPTAFVDTFANTNAYSVVSGGAPSLNPANTYVDIVHADSPLRHYRLGETSGTVAYDIGGNGQNGTLHGGYTQGVAGAISGDTDAAATFNGTTGYVSLPTSGLPTGNGAWSLEAWINVAAYPGASVALICAFGTAANHERAAIFMNTSGGVAADTFNGATTASAPVAKNVWHHVVGTWDGTTLKCYLDGALVNSATPGAMTIPSPVGAATIATDVNTVGWFGGSIDEACIYGAALSSTQVSNHYTAGHTGASGTVSNAMSIPAAGQVKFGSPAWGAVQTWQTRFRFVTGLTNASFYLHYTDANNYIRAWVNGTTLNLEQKVAGVTNTLATAVTIALVHEAWYWLQLTQFPSVTGFTPYVQALLLSDNEGAVGSQIASIAGATTDALTAMTGYASLAATGAALVVGGAFTNSHALFTFGPGAWSFASSGTGAASGAWDGAPVAGSAPTSATTNCYASGPVTSFGCARIDAAPAGTLNAQWIGATTASASGNLTTTATASPISAAGNVLGVSAYLKSSGVAVSCTQALKINEYDSNGNFLRTGSVSGASVTGAQAAWVQVSGTYTTGASCASVALILSAVDATSASANGIVWWDNCVIYNQTTTGQTSMPYCEMRYGNSPAQLMVSGIVGDVPAPCLFMAGTSVASGQTFGPLTLTVGKRRLAHKDTRTVSPTLALHGTNQPVLDSTVMGGYHLRVSSNSQGHTIEPIAWQGYAPDTLAALQGVLSVFLQYQTAVSTPADVRFSGSGSGSAFVLFSNDGGAVVPLYNPLNPLTNTTITMVNLGQVSLFSQGFPATADPTQALLGPINIVVDTNPSLGNVFAGDVYGSMALVYIDGGVLILTANNQVQFSAGGWTWFYADGTRGSGAYSQIGLNGTSSGVPQPAQALPQAITSTAYTAVASVAEPYFWLDPTTLIGTVAVQHLTAVCADSAGTREAAPIISEIVYSPRYLYPN